MFQSRLFVTFVFSLVFLCWWAHPLKIFIFKFIFFVWGWVFCQHLCLCMLDACGGQEKASDLVNWSYRQLLPTVWVLGIELESSGRAVSVLNVWAISSSQDFFFCVCVCVFLFVHMCLYICVSVYVYTGAPEVSEDVRFPGAGVTGECGLPSVDRGLNFWKNRKAFNSWAISPARSPLISM